MKFLPIHRTPSVFLLLLLATTPLTAAAATYICQIDGKAVFSTEKLSKQCRLSQMNGISDGESGAASAAASDPIVKIWESEQFGRYDDIKILPTARDTTVTNSAEAANPRMNIKLRNQPAAGSNAKSSNRSANRPRTPAPVIAAPPPKPQLTRKQILQNEVRNEQSALVREQAQLNVAKKKGNSTRVRQLEQAVRDRQANIRAIQNEMKR